MTESLESIVLREIDGGIWHTTSVERFYSILVCGEILPDPDIPQKERWKTTKGKEFYPYVRVLGGVSLFEFNHFNPEIYSQAYPVCSWREFVPFQNSCHSAVWIEIDREIIADQFIDGSSLLTKWKENKAWRHTIMPLIEAAHIGAIQKKSFKRAFFVSKDDNQIHEIRLP